MNEDDSRETYTPRIVIAIVVIFIFIAIVVSWYAAKWYKYCTESMERLRNSNETLRGTIQAMRKNIDHGDNTINILRQRLQRK